MSRRLRAAFLVAFVFAAACGADEPAPEAGRTTVPSITSAPAGSSSGDVPPVDSGDDGGTGDSTATTTLAPTPTAAPFGDLDAVEIRLTELVRLDEPIDTAVAPNGEWWIAERGGRVLVIDPTNGAVGDVVVDISGDTRASGERGLLGIAVDETALYVNFTDRSGTTHVEAFVLDDRGRPADRHSLLTIDQPFANHNGGAMAIGPDGHLYVGVGDGGSGGDPLGSGQDPSTLLGAILRIDPTPGADTPYAIPADNPFADGAEGTPEIFMIGARNPWRISFDSVTGDLWVADVGQNLYEEITLLLASNGWGRGANLGWNLREGTHEFSGDRPDGNVDPVFEYAHGGDPTGCSISGGYVYRGTAIPDLVGSYVFGDYCTARLWAVSIADAEVAFRDLGHAVPGGNLAGFGVDPAGELVALSLAGSVVRIEAS